MKYLNERVEKRFTSQPTHSKNIDYVVVYMSDTKEKWCCVDREKLLRICDGCPFETCVNFTHQVINFIGDVEDSEQQFPEVSYES